MLKKILFLLTLTLCTFATLHLVKGAITNSSRVIPYQGRLTDSGGNNVADGTYSMTFKVYTVSTGGSSSFTEAHSSVSVTSGLFSVLLGSLSASGVNLDFANPPYYLGITIAANAEMSPRIQLGFAPLAHNSQYLDGTPLSSFQLNTGVLTGAVGTNTRLQATGTGTGSTGNGSIYFLDSSGNSKGRFDTGGVASATGGTITNSGGYTIHTFTSSGTFTPAYAGTVEYLVVGGGGGGGANRGGGGGGGGFKTGTEFAVTAQAYTITVGGGGSAGNDSVGGDGGNSVFSTITSTGGGGGGYPSINGRGGGSGGGGGGAGTATSGGLGESGQGNNGGTADGGGYDGGGGGGGATAVGVNGAGNTAGSGGNGTASSITGSSVVYAGGGGAGYDSRTGGSAGAGGTGGGANGGAPGSGGTANTGGGGGGGNVSQLGGAGGSGIVIIRYPTILNGYGTLYIGATNTSSADLAEYYVTGDKTLSAGDVVSIAPDDNSKGVLQKASKPYDSKLVGVISTNPGVVLGSIDGDTQKADKRQLALAGRVPVKIDPDSEPIEVGDFLTSSDKPGYAKKATESGYVIGKALENWDPSTGSGPSAIEVFINLIYANAEKRFDSLQSQVDKLRLELDELRRQR